MSKAHLTALAAALAIGALAPPVAAQDTSSAGVARPDTSAYTGGSAPAVKFIDVRRHDRSRRPRGGYHVAGERR